MAVLVAREARRSRPGPTASLMVPFGGADHDWAALELAACDRVRDRRAAGSCSAPPARMPGRARRERPAGQRLADRPAVRRRDRARPCSPSPVARASSRRPPSAGLLIIGLSERWRKEGLGETRRAIARSAPAPIVFVRRGERPGALAPSSGDDALRLVLGRGCQAFRLSAARRCACIPAVAPRPAPVVYQFGSLD